MKIAVIGLGYVGTVSCACFAEIGHQVIGVDKKQLKVDALNSGKSVIYEDGLDELIQRGIEKKQLVATSSIDYAIENSEVAIICVGTPSTKTGSIDTTYLYEVSKSIASILKGHETVSYAVINRSTCLPNIHQNITKILSGQNENYTKSVNYICHPEFLREGNAISDFFSPPKIVFGINNEKSKNICQKLYPSNNAPVFYLPVEVAAMIKYADNCFHALKVTFANEIGLLCKNMDIDARNVMEVFCQDTKLNISTKYLRPGMAFGGSCLPKDLRCILDYSRINDLKTKALKGIWESNNSQITNVFNAIKDSNVKKAGVIGLTFKEKTNDIRESPMVYISEQLIGTGNILKIYDYQLSNLKNTEMANYIESLNIEHLTKLLCSDFEEVIDSSEILLINHRLNEQAVKYVRENKPKYIVDLIGIDDLKDLDGYYGLYW